MNPGPCPWCDCCAAQLINCDCPCHWSSVQPVEYGPAGCHLSGVPDELLTEGAGTLTIDEWRAWDANRATAVAS